jgi:hypothetical protein
MFWIRAGKFFVAVLMLAGLMVPASASYGQTGEQTPGWSEPALISYGWFPDITADASGRVHIVWSSGTTGYDVVMYSTTMDGVTWTGINDIAAKPTLGAVTRPTIIIDPLGVFHMTFRDYTVYYTHGPADSVSAATLIPYRQVSKGASAYFSKVARDSQGRLHFIITENVFSAACSLCFHVFYRYSDDNGQTFSDLVNISEAVLTGAAKPQVVIDRQDNIHVVWEAGRGGDLGQLLTLNTKVYYTASYDRGTTWETPVEFQTPPIEPEEVVGETPAAPAKTTARNVVIGMDGVGNLMAAWLGLPQDLIYYRISSDQGRTWTAPQPIAGVWGGWSLYFGKLDTYTMATDRAGDIHLVFVGRTVEDEKLRYTSDDSTILDLLHVSWEGVNWSKPDTVTTLVGDVPEWPRLAVSNGNQLNLIWFVRDQENIYGDPSGYQVWYSRGLSSASFVPSVPLPTIEPTVRPTNTLPPAATISPDATPTVDFAQLPPTTGEGQEPFTESNLLALIGASLFPAAMLVVVVAAIVLIRRR